jgi:Lrp/AsnC family transcriptional regulator, regulator for asnA, asnC and gidA
MNVNMKKQNPHHKRIEKLDELDLSIIRALQQDGRASLTELGKSLGVTHATIGNHLEKLLKEHIIEISAVVDAAKVGFPTQVLMGMSADLAHIQSIEQQLPRLEEITFVSTTTGQFDFLIGAAFASDAELRNFIVHKLSQIKGVRGTQTFHILNLGKRTWHWKVPVNQPRGHRRQRNADESRGLV